MIHQVKKKMNQTFRRKNVNDDPPILIPTLKILDEASEI